LICPVLQAAVVEQLQQANQRNLALVMEMDALKAQQLRDCEERQQRQEEESRLAFGLNSHLDMHKTVRPLEKILRDLQKQQQLQQQRPYQSTANQRKANNRKSPLTQPGEGTNQTGDGKQEGDDQAEATTIAVDKKEFEDIVRDCVTQERLIAGFQKENERLMKAMKDKELEEQARQSRLMDEKEELNKELNRLFTNAAVDLNGDNDNNDDHASLRLRQQRQQQQQQQLVVVSSQQKTAEQLRFELDLDAKLRGLQEKHAQLCKDSAERERKLLAQLENGKREIADLQQRNHELSNKSMDALEAQLKEQQEVNQRQREKLHWFLENQQLVDASQQEIDGLKKVVQVFTEQLVKKGVPLATIRSYVERCRSSPNGPASSSLLESVLLNQTTAVDGSKPNVQSKPNRNYADVKKIRYFAQFFLIR
jgi:hypothetical protein